MFFFLPLSKIFPPKSFCNMIGSNVSLKVADSGLFLGKMIKRFAKLKIRITIKL